MMEGLLVGADKKRSSDSVDASMAALLDAVDASVDDRVTVARATGDACVAGTTAVAVLGGDTSPPRAHVVTQLTERVKRAKLEPSAASGPTTPRVDARHSRERRATSTSPTPSGAVTGAQAEVVSFTVPCQGCSGKLTRQGPAHHVPLPGDWRYVARCAQCNNGKFRSTVARANCSRIYADGSEVFELTARVRACACGVTL